MVRIYVVFCLSQWPDVRGNNTANNSNNEKNCDYDVSGFEDPIVPFALEKTRQEIGLGLVFLFRGYLDIFSALFAAVSPINPP